MPAVATTTTAPVAVSDTKITVASAAGFAVGNVILVENELMNQSAAAAGLADGVYEVVLASPAGALRNPSCFTIGPPLVAITTIRGPVAGLVPPAARNADAALNPCAHPAFQTLTISGGRR